MSSHELSRREMLKAAAAAGVTAVVQTAAGDDPPASAPVAAFYYVDGYHGVDGHMPASSLANVLNGLEKFPEWKVSFEIEPYSWAVFARNDRKSIERLKRLVADASPNARVEMVSGAYGQAYMWNASGESCIRQIAFGLAELRAAFPGIVEELHLEHLADGASAVKVMMERFAVRTVRLQRAP